jgi:hypothetical protein
MSRTDKIFQEIMDEQKPEFDQIQMRTKKIHHYLIDLQRKILLNARKPCKQEYDLVEKNGVVYYDDTGYKIRIKDNTNADADANMGNFIECLSRHDFGMKEFFDKTNLNFRQINDLNKRCLDSCFDHDWDKTDIELKACVKRCITNTISEFGSNCDQIDNKIKEVLSKL